MATALDTALEQIKKLTGTVGAMQKTIETLGRGRQEREDKVVKSLMDARGKAFTNMNAGWRPGDPLADVMDVIDPRHVKSLGQDFATFLQEVAFVTYPERFTVKDFSAVKKSLESRAVPVQKAALAEGSGATGGYTVPTQFNNDLLRIAAEKSFLRQLCRSLPMTGRDLRVPVLDQTATTASSNSGSNYFGGLYWTWQPEASNYQTNAETEPKFRQVELVARDLVGVVVTSNQLIQDSPLALESILTTLFRDAMAWAYDYFILQGNGAGQPLGMVNSPCAISVTRSVSAHFNLADGANMLSRMLPSSYEDCVWLAHPSVIPELITMTNGATNSPFLVWLNPIQSGNDGGPASKSIPAMFFGRPLIFTEKLPKLAASSTGSVALVDPSKYLVGDRMAIQIEASQYPLFQRNQTMYRIIARWDGQPELNAAITLADGAYTVSPVVLLAA